MLELCNGILAVIVLSLQRCFVVVVEHLSVMGDLAFSRLPEITFSETTSCQMKDILVYLLSKLLCIDVFKI